MDRARKNSPGSSQTSSSSSRCGSTVFMVEHKFPNSFNFLTKHRTLIFPPNFLQKNWTLLTAVTAFMTAVTTVTACVTEYWPLLTGGVPPPPSASPGAGAWRRATTKVVFGQFLSDELFYLLAKKIAGYKKSKTADLGQKIDASHEHINNSQVWKLILPIITFILRRRNLILIVYLMIKQRPLEENHHLLNTFQVYWKVFYE